VREGGQFYSGRTWSIIARRPCSILLRRSHTPRLVSATDAEQRQAYYCPYCGAHLFRRISDKGVSYYVCHKGEKHRHPTCIRKEKESITRAVNSPEFSVDHFFSGILKSEPEEKNGETTEISTVMVDTGEKAKLPEDARHGSFRVLPYSSIQQLVDDDIKIKGRNAVIDYDKNQLVDLIVFKEWIRFVFPSFPGGKRILECCPNYCELERRYLQFRCYVKNPHNDSFNNYYFNLYFGKKEKPFNRFASLLFSNEANDSGATRPKSKYSTVFVAGNWEKDNVNNMWADTKRETYKADFVSSKQIYAPKKHVL